MVTPQTCEAEPLLNADPVSATTSVTCVSPAFSGERDGVAHEVGDDRGIDINTEPFHLHMAWDAPGMLLVEAYFEAHWVCMLSNYAKYTNGHNSHPSLRFGFLAHYRFFGVVLTSHCPVLPSGPRSAMFSRIVPYAATQGLRPFHDFFPDMLWRMPPSERMAYLTFDDGPTPEMTTGLLHTLDQYDARATFFLIGHHAEQHPSLVEDIYDAGHAIGNHTFTHPNAWTTPQRDVRLQLSNTTMLLEDLTGAPVNVMRPPYGKFTGAMRTWCAERQQRMVMWDVMPGDFLDSATANRVAQFVIRTVRPGSIIVLHDNPICEHVTPAALDTILSTLSDDGWTFAALR